MKTYCIGWTTDFCDNFADISGCINVNAETEEEVIKKAKLPYHSVVDFVKVIP